MPEHLVVIGGGVIGLELGSVWRRLGAKVTVVEFLDQLLPGMDGEVRKEAARSSRSRAWNSSSRPRSPASTVKGNKATLTVEPAAGGAAETLEADACWSRSAASPNTDGLGLDKIGLELNKRGQIETDHDFRTTVAGVWAIGDVIPGPMLAHKAEDEGIAVAENIAGQTGIVNHAVIPSVVYTMPEIAGVGLTEEAGQGTRARSRSASSRCSANSRAKTNHEPDGFVKVIADAKTDRVLGVWMHRLGRRHDDRPGRAGDGIRRDQRGHRLHLPRPPDAFRSDQGSGDGGAGQADPHFDRQATGSRSALSLVGAVPQPC